MNEFDTGVRGQPVDNSPSDAYVVTANGPPVLTSVAPAGVGYRGGEQLTLSGEHLHGLVSVILGDHARALAVSGSSDGLSATATMPALIIDRGEVLDVLVTAGCGASRLSRCLTVAE